MKVMFVSNWGESSSSLLLRFSRQTPKLSGNWKNISGTDKPEEADVVIAFDGVPSGFDYDPENTILLTREPNFIRSPETHGFRHVNTWEDGHCGITWWLGKSYDELMELPCPEKVYSASCVTSSKHKRRNRFIKKIFGRRRLLELKKTQIDLFGRGHAVEDYGKNYKGELSGHGNCKLDGLLPYRYSLVLENSSQKNYWTEKLADALLAWCVPVYWGCPNIDDFFETGTVLKIDLDMKKTEINHIVTQPVSSGMLDGIKLAREKIINEYNIWEVIREIIKKELGPVYCKKSWEDRLY